MLNAQTSYKSESRQGLMTAGAGAAAIGGSVALVVKGHPFVGGVVGLAGIAIAVVGLRRWSRASDIYQAAQQQRMLAIAAQQQGVAAPKVVSTGGDALSVLLGLPDPSNLPLGTRSADGRFVVTQSRAYDSRPQWTAVMGGGVPGMIT